METYSDTYPDHLTIIQDGGDNDSERSELATEELQQRINDLFQKQQQGGAGKKKSGSKKKKSGSKKNKSGSKKQDGGAPDRTPLVAFQKIVKHIYEHIQSKGKKLSDAMKEASRVRKLVIAKNPNLVKEKKHMELADATIAYYNSNVKK